MFIKFNASTNPTIGLELEVQTINSRTGELVAGAQIILSQLQGNLYYKPELFTSTVEINTPVCDTISELDEALREILKQLMQIAAESNLGILISGCHPFASWQQQQITQQERYQNLLHRIQWPVRQFLIFGLHVHVGVDQADKAIYIMHRLTQYIPHLIALSASSPFWNGYDTGLAASRIKIFEELPNAGIPYYFPDWKSYSRLVKNLILTNSIDTVRDIWWDIRPHPIFGTVEIRVCDAMPTVKENMALTTLIYLLVLKFGREFDENHRIAPTPRWILEENKWRAARYGIRGNIILNETGETQHITEAICKMYEDLLKFIDNIDLGYTKKYIELIPELIRKGPSYLRQRQWYRKRPGDYKFIVDNLQRETHEDRLLDDV
ncbi:MAG: glutamate--cysteine ligase [Calditrichia bacterium]